MRETVAKKAKSKKSKSLVGKIKDLALSKIATPSKSKKNAERTGAAQLIEGNLVAKQMVKPGRRSANPQKTNNPAHAPGHRRLNMH